MAKIVLNDIGSGFNRSVVNDNFDKIEDDLQDRVLYRNNPTGEPNQMEHELDMNGFRIINGGAAASDNDYVTLGQIEAIVQALSGDVPALYNEFVGDGVTDTFVLTGASAYGDNAVVVFLDGLNLRPGTDFTSSGNTLVFTTPPGVGEEIVTYLPFSVSAGGGSGSGALPALYEHGVSFVFNNSSPSTDRHSIDLTPTNGWNLGAGKHTVGFDFLSNSYFTENPNGHFAIVVRSDNSSLATSIRGHGMVMGNVSFAPNGNPVAPSTQVEGFWTGSAVGSGGNNHLFNETGGLSTLPLEDGVQYKVIVESTVTDEGAMWIRYRLYRKETTYNAWELERDTGDVLDPYGVIDPTKTGIVFAHVFEDAFAAPWTVTISNIVSIWSEAGEINNHVRTSDLEKSPDVSTVSGDLAFTGSGARMQVDTLPLADNSTFAIEPIDANAAMYLQLYPKGTATGSGVLSLDANGWASNWAYAKYGMEAGVGVIETFSNYTIPPLEIKIGGVLTTKFNPTSTVFYTNVDLSNSNRMLISAYPWVNDTDWAIQETATNQGTSVVAIPNGTSKAANFFAVDNSSRAGAWAYAAFGINNGVAEIETLGIGGASSPEISFQPGGVESVRVTSGGVKFTDATVQSTAYKPVTFRGYRTTTLALTHFATTTVSFTTHFNNGGGGFSGNTYTIPVTGTYRMSATVAMAKTTNGTLTVGVYIRRNGATTNPDQLVGGASGDFLNGDIFACTATGSLTCTAGDTIQVQVFPVIAGGTLAITNSAAWVTDLCIEKVG